MARPSVWRLEFQQVEKEYIALLKIKKNRAHLSQMRPALEIAKCELQVGVTGGQHGGETGHFFFAAAFFARLFKRPAAAHDFQRAFAIDFFLKPTQRAFYGFAFF
jgi:hypothetical protein